MKKFFYGLLAGIVLTVIMGAIFLWPKSRPEQSGLIVTVQPTEKQEKKADLVVTQQQTGKVSGETKVTTQTEPVKIPVAGTIQTVYTNKNTGEVIAAGSHPVTGETVVKVEPDKVTAETTFTDTETIAIEIPKPPPKRNELGMFYDGVLWAYYKRDLLSFSFSRIEAAPWIGAAFEFSENDLNLMVGVSVRF